MYERVKETFLYSFTAISGLKTLDVSLVYLIKHVSTNMLFGIMPFFIIALSVALLSPFLFGGWNFTLKAIDFKFESINPFVNLKRIFSVQILLNIVKSIIKFTIIFGLFILYLYYEKYHVLSLWNTQVDLLFLQLCLLIKSYLMTISIGIIIIIAVDVMFNYFEYNKNTMMTSQELKDEHKEMEGNDEVKRKLRMFQMNLIRNRLSVMVPKATVIITNPTHYAIAIGYNEHKDKAPRVITKGKDEIAKQIREIAVKHAIPIYEAPSLARSIFHTSKIGAPINPGLYMAVAIVFSYIYQLKQYQMGNAPSPKYISDLKIPGDLLYDE